MSYHIDVPQYSSLWLDARLGIPTASRFSDILTPKTWKLSESKGMRKYMAQLAAEWRLRAPIQPDVIVWATERGIDMEPESISYYELIRNVRTQECGFFLSEDKRYGASPDRIIGTEGLLEMKNLLADNHLLCLFENRIPEEYFIQVHAQLLVTGLEWADYLSYSPGLPPFLYRVYPEPKYQNPMRDAITEFCDRLDAMKQKLLSMYEA